MEDQTRNAAVRRLLVAALLAALTLSVSSWFFLSMGKFTDGRLCAPLDDSFIYFQYARDLAEGRGFSYSPGDGPTTGATSFLYTLILALGYRLGATGENLILYGFVLGSCFLFLSSLLVARTVESFSNWIAGTGAAVLFLLNGHILWSYLSGMEVGLFGSTMLLTLFMLQSERPKGSFYGTSVAAALVGWSRPEGFFLAVPVAVTLLIVSGKRPRGERIAVFVISLHGGMQFLANYGLTGSFASTGAQAKSVFFTQEPDILVAYMRRFLELPYFVLNVFLTDFHSSSFGTQWARVAAFFLKTGFLLAALGFLFVRKHRNPLALVLISWVFLSLFLSLVPWAWDVHLHRYQAPFFPVFLVLACAGFGMLAEEAGRACLPARRARAAAGILSVTALCFLFGVTGVSFFGTAKRMVRLYAHNCENIFHQQVRVANWIRTNTGDDVIVGLNDAGAISYVGQRKTYDIVGLTTPGQAMNWRSGIGSVIEALENLPEEKLPDLLAIYPNWFPFLVSSGMAGDEIFRAHLDLNTICGGTDKVIYLPDWSLLHSGDLPPRTPETQTLRLVDEVDVADLTSEARHSYEVIGTWRSIAKVLEDAPTGRTLDGGRIIFDGERMTVRCVPGRELAIVGRLDDRSAGITFHLRGILAGTSMPGKKSSRWSYAVLKIPRELVRLDRLEVTVRRGPASGGQEKSYGSYHYWFLQ
jgi:hypothetical protein